MDVVIRVLLSSKLNYFNSLYPVVNHDSHCTVTITSIPIIGFLNNETIIVLIVNIETKESDACFYIQTKSTKFKI